MADSWEDRKRTIEEEYFAKQNKAALEKRAMAARQPGDTTVGACPKDHSRMEKIQKHNITLERCPQCGGIWLDKKAVADFMALVRSSSPDLGAILAELFPAPPSGS